MIHRFAEIHPNAKIGDQVQVGPFTTIYEDVEIGDESWIGPNVTIMPGARIGKKCRIFPGAVISAIPQDLKFAGEKTLVVIGDNCTIRECATINRGTSDKMKTQIGNNCLLMAYVHVAHDCLIGDNCIIANAVQVAGHVEIEDYAIIGGTTAIHQFSKIGRHSIVSGGSLVRKDVPPFTKAGREPIGYCGINSIGLRRRGFDANDIESITETYRLLYLNGLSFGKAMEKIENEIAPSSESVRKIVDFIKGSSRGIMKGYTSSKQISTDFE
jgi:UDP-N-acetylglucosamine acyltransferase